MIKETVLAGLLLGVPTMATADNWLSIQPAVNTNKSQTTTRIEAGNGSNLYFISDVDNLEDDPNAYVKVRLTEPIRKNTGFVLEHKFDYHQNMKNSFRAGLSYNPTDNITLRFLSGDNRRNNGPAIDFYIAEQLSDRIGAALTVSYDVEPQNAYIEPELSYKAKENMRLFVQGRSYGRLKNARLRKMDAIVGMKFNF